MPKSLKKKRCGELVMFNVLEAIYSTHSGEFLFEHLRERTSELKKSFPVTENGKDNDVKVVIDDFDDVKQKQLYLTSFFPFEEYDLTYHKEDYEFEFQNGENPMQGCQESS